MKSPILQVFLYTLIPLAASLLGGLAAAVRKPGPKLGSGIQHFAAGAVFAAVGVELLPDILERRRPVAVVVGFAIGVALMLGIKWVSETYVPEGREGEDGGGWPLALIVTMGVDVLIDGLLVGIGFAVGAKEGVLLTIALSVEILFLGLSLATVVGDAGISRWTAVLVAAGLGLLFVLGGVGGAALLGGLQGPAMEGLLSFGCAALLYLVTEELLVEAHEKPHTPLTALPFFVGFLLLMVLTLLA